MKAKLQRGEVPYNPQSRLENPHSPQGRPGIVSGNVGIVYEKLCTRTVANVVHLPSGLLITQTRRLRDAKALVAALRAEFPDWGFIDRTAAGTQQPGDDERLTTFRRRMLNIARALDEAPYPNSKPAQAVA